MARSHAAWSPASPVIRGRSRLGEPGARLLGAPRPDFGPWPDHPVDEVLAGGVANSGQVVRIGATVHRPLAPRSEATHALLRHLCAERFAAAPRILDVRGRYEVLSWIPGRAARTPLPAWAQSEESLHSVGVLLRRFHDTVETLDPDAFLWPDDQVPGLYRGRLVSHNDIHPGNLIFDGDRAVGLIDFDLAGPGSRIWDLAAAARCWCPLLADDDVPAALAGRRFERFRLLLDAYGATGTERSAVAQAVLANHEWTFQIVLARVLDGHPGFQQYWNAVGPRAVRAHRWLRASTAELVARVG